MCGVCEHEATNCMCVHYLHGISRKLIQKQTHTRTQETRKQKTSKYNNVQNVCAVHTWNALNISMEPRNLYTHTK